MNDSSCGSDQIYIEQDCFIFLEQDRIPRLRRLFIEPAGLYTRRSPVTADSNAAREILNVLSCSDFENC